MFNKVLNVNIGIVGSEGAKFTKETEAKAREVIREVLRGNEVVVSGGCHLGGIDIWAVEEAKAMGLDVMEFLPKTRKWDGGYKQRNQLIAENSDIVYCITLKELPDSYTGMKFNLCYHCGTKEHVKSGGCWTVKYAKKIGKKGEIIVI
jgi:hypothetical protein